MARPVSFARSFAALAETNPARLFLICAGVHLLLWTAIPALTSPNALTDVIEGYAWGHEWPLGTWKHPPLAAWILEGLAVLTGRASWAPFLAGQISVTVAFWAVWQTARRILDEPGALTGTLLLVGIAYYNVITPEFNPNVLQLPLWALMARSFYRAVKDNRTADWIMLGLWSAAGLYAKYSTLLLIVTLGILMLVRPDCRKYLKTHGPWLATLVALLLVVPHIFWLVQHHFLPFAYTAGRFERTGGGPGFFIAPWLLVAGQAAVTLPAIVIYAIAFRRGARTSRPMLKSFDGMFLSFVTFGPFLLAFIFAALGGFTMHTMWGTPFWNFLGVWAIFLLRPAFTAAALRRFGYGLGAVFILGLAGIAGKNLYEPYVTHKAGRIYFPGPAVADRIGMEWQSRYHAPLRYVIGDIWAAGNAAFHAPGPVSERPHVLISGDYGISPGVTPQDIAKYGGVIVWCRGDCTHEGMEEVPPWYWTEFVKKAEMQPVLSFPQQTGAPVPPVKIGWAIVPPEGTEKP